MSNIKLLSRVRCFGGEQNQYTHESSELNCEMVFSVYLPPAALDRQRVPVLYWLSGLTCTDQNFSTKAGAQRVASALGIALVIPDTSPRGDGVPTDPDQSYDLGLGAGFYVDAIQEPWAKHYRMYSYIVRELPRLLGEILPIDGSKQSIAGHSMGGHGALVIALNNPSKYRAVSAFSPIVAPSLCPWGQKVFGHYLGSDEQSWLKYDAVDLIRNKAVHLPMLIDQGREDPFLETQLKTDLLISTCREVGYPVQVRYQEGYDHSYYFVSSFMEEHLRFHAQHLAPNN